MKEQPNNYISIFVPLGSTESEDYPKDQADNHALGRLVRAVGRTIKVPINEVQSQWAETINSLLAISDQLSNRADGWSVDEIEVGFTLNVKGELQFIAEAGAEASIRIVMKPKS